MAVAQALGEAVGASKTPEAAAIWKASAPILRPGPAGSFDEVAVKDPSVVFFEGRWHLFYTARSKDEYGLGYVGAESLEGLAAAKRHHLERLRGEHSSYAAAPQVFFFAPKKMWCLVFQTRDANYQPVLSTTKTLGDPESWSTPEPLVAKTDTAKWIDFWVLCDEERAYLYYTRGHRDVCVMDTGLAQFPKGFGDPRTVFSPVHEAVHVYKVAGQPLFHMICEYRGDNGMRRFGLAASPHPLGPWKMLDEQYAAGPELSYCPEIPRWTEEVSHGEAIRTGYDQHLEYDADHARLLVQGLPKGAHDGAYELLPWALGLVELQR
jgi:endo-1,4-beta-xylanase